MTTRYITLLGKLTRREAVKEGGKLAALVSQSDGFFRVGKAPSEKNYASGHGGDANGCFDVYSHEGAFSDGLLRPNPTLVPT